MSTEEGAASAQEGAACGGATPDGAADEGATGGVGLDLAGAWAAAEGAEEAASVEEAELARVALERERQREPARKKDLARLGEKLTADLTRALHEEVARMERSGGGATGAAGGESACGGEAAANPNPHSHPHPNPNPNQASRPVEARRPRRGHSTGHNRRRRRRCARRASY